MLTGNLSNYAVILGGLMNFINREQYENSSGIYAIENKINGKVYIGQTKMRFVKRYWHHCWKLSHNEHDNCYLQTDYDQFGADSFEFKILTVMDHTSNMDEMEQKWIAFYRESNRCYNIQEGGHHVNLDTYITKEARQIVGEKNRQRLLGSKLPESTKENMRKAAAKGSSSRLSKLTDSEVLEIAALIRAGKSDYAIAPIFNVTRENIAHIRKGHTWSHLTGFARS